MNRPIRAVEVGEACVPNIGARGQRRRFRSGVVRLILGLAVTAWAVVMQTSALILAPIFVIFVLACLGFFQAREKT